MNRLFGNTRRTQQDQTPSGFSLAGKAVHCPHCDGAQFIVGQAQLNTALATLIELDWLNKTASILRCTDCGQIQWFAMEPTRSA